MCGGGSGHGLVTVAEGWPFMMTRSAIESRDKQAMAEFTPPSAHLKLSSTPSDAIEVIGPAMIPRGSRISTVGSLLNSL
jgi:hypothetical protein